LASIFDGGGLHQRRNNKFLLQHEISDAFALWPEDVRDEVLLQEYFRRMQEKMQI